MEEKIPSNDGVVCVRSRVTNGFSHDMKRTVNPFSLKIGRIEFHTTAWGKQ
ncbi:MAG TPA: hypothetical protein VH415_15035 [Nitrososphaeraceae archaeon]|jgi:hypothetical protein